MLEQCWFSPDFPQRIDSVLRFLSCFLTLLNWVTALLHGVYRTSSARSLTVTHQAIHPPPLLVAQCYKASHRPSAWRAPPPSTLSPSHPVFCWVTGSLIPRIFSRASVLCCAGNVRRNSNDSGSWCGYCYRVAMATRWISVHSVNGMLLRRALSLAALMCAHICANGARRDRLLEAQVYQLFWSVIVNC